MGGRTWRRGLGELLPLGSIHFWRGRDWVVRACECVSERERERRESPSLFPWKSGCVRTRSPAASISVSADEAHVRTRASERVSEREGARASRRAFMMRGCSGGTGLAQNQQRAGKKRGRDGWEREGKGGRGRQLVDVNTSACVRACAVDETFPLHSHALVNALACWRVCLLLFATAVICYPRGLRSEADVVSLSEGAWRGGKLEARLLSLPAGPQTLPLALVSVCDRQLVF